MTNFSEKRKNKEEWSSEPFFAFDRGYAMILSVYAAGTGIGAATHVSVYLHLLKGPYDDELRWPLARTFTIQLLNQLKNDNHYYQRVRFTKYICPECSQRVVEYVEDSNSTGLGLPQFISHYNIIDHVGYLMSDTVYFKIS